jgi:hypothetical protein
MSCRTTPAGSAFTSYARIANGSVVSDVATLSLFHYLRSRHQGQDTETRRSYTREQYDELLTRQRQRVERLNGISDARRQSIIERLDAARTAEMPDQSTVYALFNLNPTVRERGQGLQRFLREVSNELSISYDEAATKFKTLEDSIDRSRGAQAPSTYTEENIAEARRRQIATETGSVHAMATLIVEMQNIRVTTALNAVQRIEQRNQLEQPREMPSSGLTVSAYGYDRYSGRLEITVIDENGESRNLAYRNVPESVMNESDLVAYWEQEILGNPEYMYATQYDADIDSAAGRCGICGQFANNSHSCPVSGMNVREFGHYGVRNTQQHTTVLSVDENGNEIVREISVSLPAARAIREAYNESGAIKFGVSQWFQSYDANQRYHSARVYGDILAYRDESGNLVISTAGANCNCSEFRENGTCEHINYITQATRQRLLPPQRAARRAATPEEREALARERQALLEATLARDWSRKDDLLAEARSTWNNNAEVKYSEQYDDFLSVYNAAVEAKKNNDNNPVIPFERENALGEWAKRGSGQAFGVELEYEFPPSMSWQERNEAQRRIGQELFAAGLASSQSQLGYGASKRNGFRDTHKQSDGTSNWSWERDGSVNGGELVTPAMYDEPETWENIDKAVEILTRNGAVASRKAGAHVHVGTSMYNGDPKKYAELARMMTQHEDVMIRLASDPKRGTHRNNGYSSVLEEVPVDGFQDVGALRNWQRSRTRVLNFGGVSSEDSRKDHPEFRIFDSTLNSGAIQAQIKVAVAMTHAAARISDDTGGTKRPKEPHGSHAQRLKALGKRTLTGEALKEDTTTFRSLIDTLFTSKKDKDQIISIFAQTKWSPSRR